MKGAVVISRYFMPMTKSWGITSVVFLMWIVTKRNESNIETKLKLKSNELYLYAQPLEVILL